MTEESRALIVRQPLTPSTWQMISEIAPVIYKSRMFGVSSWEAAAATMLKGYDLGLSMTASFEFIKVVEGKPELIPRGALALLHDSPEIKEIKIERLVDGKGGFLGYQCCMIRQNGFGYTAKWTMEDAKRAGLTKPRSAWETYPENMCLWRAVGFAADVVAPDVCAGGTNLMKMPEKYGVGLSEQGDVIEGSWISVSAEPESPATPPAPDLSAIVDRFGPEAVMAANNGMIPASDAEVAAVAAVLGWSGK